MHDILIQVYFIMEQKSVYLVAGQRTSNKIVIGPYPILRKSFQGLNCEMRRKVAIARLSAGGGNEARTKVSWWNVLIPRLLLPQKKKVS